MKKIFLTIGIISMCAFNINAQLTEFGLQIGEMHYIGDMTVHKLGDRKEAHVAYGAFFRNTFLHGYLSARLGLTLGKISGNDKDFNPSGSLFHRNLNFDSYVQDFNLIFDVNLLGINPCEQKFFSPFISGGISVFHFNPIADYYGQIVNLQSLGTEGQGIAQFGNVPKYSLIQPSFPVGGGIKFVCRDVFIVSLSVMYHFTNTDYLDDVSGNYYDPQIIQKYNGKAAAYLSNRSDYQIKYDATGVGNIKRGDASKKDAFIVSSIDITYIIQMRCGRNFKGLKYQRGGATKCANDF